MQASFLESREEPEAVEVVVDGRKEIKQVLKSRLGLVVLTIELEERLPNLQLSVPAPHIMTSPYRKPLTHFLNKCVRACLCACVEVIVGLAQAPPSSVLPPLQALARARARACVGERGRGEKGGESNGTALSRTRTSTSCLDVRCLPESVSLPEYATFAEVCAGCDVSVL